jgi:hypothetical protein
MHIWVSFHGARGHKKLSLGAIWNFNKEQGSIELISDYGAQRAHLQGLGVSGL